MVRGLDAWQVQKNKIAQQFGRFSRCESLARGS